MLARGVSLSLPSLLLLFCKEEHPVIMMVECMLLINTPPELYFEDNILTSISSHYSITVFNLSLSSKLHIKSSISASPPNITLIYQSLPTCWI